MGEPVARGGASELDVGVSIEGLVSVQNGHEPSGPFTMRPLAIHLPY